MVVEIMRIVPITAIGVVVVMTELTIAQFNCLVERQL